MKNAGFWISDFGLTSSRRRSRSHRALTIRDPQSKVPNAFTLTEMLIVVSIIIIVLAMAIPAFRFISGSRSTESAQNQVASLLSRARADAIGLQKIHGVFFYIDPATDRVACVEVRETEPPLGVPADPIHPAAAGGADMVDVYLDLVDAEPLLLPPGVGLQTLDSCAFAGVMTFTTRLDDGYIGYNRHGKTGAGNVVIDLDSADIAPGGVILFDSAGRVINYRYAFRTRTGTGVATEMGRLLLRGSGGNPAAMFDFMPYWQTNPNLQRSSIGLVLFDRSSFTSQGYTDTDPQIDASAYGVAEIAEEDWLDKNTAPLLVSRFNGSLIKGE